eukprot:PITA_17617
MDTVWLFWYSGVGITFFIVFFVLEQCLKKRNSRLPPGPPGWPVVGNLLQLGHKPYQTLFHLANRYGPLMSITLGRKTIVIVSSPDVAKEIVKTHDHIFASRTVIEAAKSLSHHKFSIIWAEHGSHWRMLRRISTTELFSAKRMEALQYLRRDQVFRTIRQILQESVKGGSINIGETAVRSVINLLGNMVFGKDMFDPYSAAFQDFKDSIWKLFVTAGTPNLVDYFPCLQPLDPQGVSRKTRICMKKLYGIVDQFIEDRLATRGNTMGDGPKDLLDVLLDTRSHEFTVADIRAYLTDLFAAGTDTTAKIMEWTMAELVRNPEKMKEAQNELDRMIGHNRMVDECDIDNLPYLRAVVKEAFRLHPPGPLLVPRRADSRCEIEGFLIPKHTTVLLNVWAMGRDPAIWKEASKFMPERFVDSAVDFRGQHLELMPFGAGRRMCVGLPLASRMIHLMLGSLLHSFDWAPPDGIRPELLDMNDKLGAGTLEKAVPLQAIATPRLPPHVYVG